MDIASTSHLIYYMASIVSIAHRGVAGNTLIGNGDATATIYGEMSTWLAGRQNGIFVQTASSGGVLADRPFQLIVHC